jgi:ribosomal protein L35
MGRKPKEDKKRFKWTKQGNIEILRNKENEALLSHIASIQKWSKKSLKEDDVIPSSNLEIAKTSLSIGSKPTIKIVQGLYVVGFRDDLYFFAPVDHEGRKFIDKHVVPSHLRGEME